MKKLGIGKKAFRLAIGAGLLFASVAWAAPIPMKVGDTLIFNFDASAFVPYSRVEVFFHSNGADPSQTADIKYFSGLDGTGTVENVLVGWNPNPGASFFRDAPNTPAVFDGDFSLVITDTFGSYDMEAWAIVTTGGVVPVEHRIEPTLSTSVPEPGSLALVGGALAGICMVRRRRT